MTTARRRGFVLALVLVASLLGGARAAAATALGLKVDAAPATAAPGTVVTLTATVTPATDPASTGLAVTCDTSWAVSGTSQTSLTPDATGLVFTTQGTVPADAMPGPRVAQCTVTDDQGGFKAANYFFSIGDATPPANEPPTVSAGGPYTVSEGGSVQLGATGSDPENGSLTYAWDLDGNGTYETSGQSATFSAAALDGPSSVSVGVQVTDDGDLTATDSTTVSITNVAPAATFTAPGSTFAGFPFALSLTSPEDPSQADTAAGFSYAFDCGDGYGAFGPASSAECPTSDVGTLSVGAEIRDRDGAVTEYRGNVSVTVTSASLCELVRAYSTDEKVASDLCAKLDRADAAATPSGRAGLLGAFANMAAAKVGKGLTAEQAAELVLLSARV